MAAFFQNPGKWRQPGRFRRWMYSLVLVEVASLQRLSDTSRTVPESLATRKLSLESLAQRIQLQSCHGGASLVVSESAGSLSSAFVHQALLPDLYIQTSRPLDQSGPSEGPLLDVALAASVSAADSVPQNDHAVAEPVLVNQFQPRFPVTSMRLPATVSAS
jgi:hypothetical protein